MWNAKGSLQLTTPRVTPDSLGTSPPVFTSLGKSHLLWVQRKFGAQVVRVTELVPHKGIRLALGDFEMLLALIAIKMTDDNGKPSQWFLDKNYLRSKCF